MQKTLIEWAQNPDGSPGYTWNPITGCLNHVNGLCKGGDFPCYAYKLANGRLKQRYLANENISYDVSVCNIPRSIAINDPFYPRFWEEKLYHPWSGKPKGIFVCDMSDLFGVGIPEEWTKTVLNLISLHKENRYYLLTKQPKQLIKFSPFPENCWVGVTATNWLSFSNALGYLATIKAKVKYLSFEPLLEHIQMDMLQKVLFPQVINWVIIGACTGSLADMQALRVRYPALEVRDNKTFTKFVAVPPPAWVREIIPAADAANVPVFIKDNILNTAWGDYRLTEGRRECPKG